MIVQRLDCKDVNTAIEMYLKGKYGELEIIDIELYEEKHPTAYVKYESKLEEEQTESPTDQVIEALGNLAQRVAELERQNTRLKEALSIGNE